MNKSIHWTQATGSPYHARTFCTGDVVDLRKGLLSGSDPEVGEVEGQFYTPVGRRATCPYCQRGYATDWLYSTRHDPSMEPVFLDTLCVRAYIYPSPFCREGWRADAVDRRGEAVELPAQPTKQAMLDAVRQKAIALDTVLLREETNKETE